MVSRAAPQFTGFGPAAMVRRSSPRVVVPLLAIGADSGNRGSPKTLEKSEADPIG
jgi:hypothetical protein